MKLFHKSPLSRGFNAVVKCQFPTLVAELGIITQLKLTSHAKKYTMKVKQYSNVYLFIYLGFYVAFNTVQVISRQVVGRAEETSTYSKV